MAEDADHLEGEGLEEGPPEIPDLEIEKPPEGGVDTAYLGRVVKKRRTLEERSLHEGMRERRREGQNGGREEREGAATGRGEIGREVGDRDRI